MIQNKYVEEMITAAEEVVRDIVERYDIKSYDDFTCPKMKALAKALAFLDDDLLEPIKQGRSSTGRASGSEPEG